MWGGGGLGVTRGRRPEGFIAEHKVVGVLPCALRQPSRGMGRGMAGVRRKAVVSVRNVVLTLTSNKRQGLSLNGRC
jgi:hypothetical protein